MVAPALSCIFVDNVPDMYDYHADVSVRDPHFQWCSQRRSDLIIIKFQGICLESSTLHSIAFLSLSRTSVLNNYEDM